MNAVCVEELLDKGGSMKIHKNQIVEYRTGSWTLFQHWHIEFRTDSSNWFYIEVKDFKKHFTDIKEIRKEKLKRINERS